MSSPSDPASLRALTDNPFHVLGLSTDAPRAAVEREGRKLLDMLDLGVARAAEYTTPLGPRPRTAERVRWALSELRDPRKRALHEAWGALGADLLGGEGLEAELPPCPEAFAITGLGRSR